MARGRARGDDARRRGARVRRDQDGVPGGDRRRGRALRRAARPRGVGQGHRERLSAGRRGWQSGPDGRRRAHLDLFHARDRERGARGGTSNAGGMRPRGCVRAPAPDGHTLTPWAPSLAPQARRSGDGRGRDCGDVFSPFRERECLAGCGAGLCRARAAVQADRVQFRVPGPRRGDDRPDAGDTARGARSSRRTWEASLRRDTAQPHVPIFHLLLLFLYVYRAKDLLVDSHRGLRRLTAPRKLRTVTLQRKLLLGFSLMVIPALLVGVQAIRTNGLVRGTLESLGERLARSRTYAEVEDAMFNQTQVIWRYLSGDPAAKKEFPLTEQVVAFWLDRWTAGLPPDELKLADRVRGIESDIRVVAGRVFKLHDAGRHGAAAVVARQELVERLQPALAEVNREIYRRAREFSVQAAFTQVARIVDVERRVLWSIIALALAAGLLASWLISRSLARPLNELRHAMAVVGAGDLDHAIEPRSSDEIGELARSFARMTEQLRQSRAQLVQSEKLASIGQMAAAAAHGLRNPLASLRAAAQLARLRVDAPAAREQLDAIIEQVDRLDVRIAHLLQFSRPAPFHRLLQ